MMGVTRTSLRGTGLACLIGLVLSACTSTDDASLVAPEPNVNPGASARLTFSVTPQPGFVDSVTGTGDWVITDHTCAPVHPFSKVPIEKQVSVPATVEQRGSSYYVTVLTDQFADDACRWRFAGAAVHLWSRGRQIGVSGAGSESIAKHDGTLTVVCEPIGDDADCVYLEGARNTIMKHPRPGLFSFDIKEEHNASDHK